MTTIKAKVTQNWLTKAKVTPQQNILVTNYTVNGTKVSISDLLDVSATSPDDGALLTYNALTKLWESRTIIENPNTEFNGGHF